MCDVKKRTGEFGWHFGNLLTDDCFTLTKSLSYLNSIWECVLTWDTITAKLDSNSVLSMVYYKNQSSHKWMFAGKCWTSAGVAESGKAAGREEACISNGTCPRSHRCTRPTAPAAAGQRYHRPHNRATGHQQLSIWVSSLLALNKYEDCFCHGPVRYLVLLTCY